MPTTDTTGTGARRARLHGALDRLLDCRGGDGVLGQVESAVKRAAPSVTGALTTEPGSIGDARRKRLHASLDRLLDSGQEWMDREAEAYSRKADASGRP
ncbi:MAG TPA: hypothetical protein VJ801_12255, partial [Polyangia bacterium]|nr:hypothetical protein [Polyangia bacterium]